MTIFGDTKVNWGDAAALSSPSRWKVVFRQKQILKREIYYLKNDEFSPLFTGTLINDYIWRGGCFIVTARDLSGKFYRFFMKR